MLKASNIHRFFDQLEVVKGVDLEIQPGEILAIVGPSGAGKSTLLHILGTLDKPSSGTLSFEGIDILKLSQKELVKFRNQQVGFVFQFHHLLPEFTALENVTMPALIAGTSKATAEAKAMELLTKLGVAHRAQHKPRELSGGEQQRVAVARSLINNPKIIFADEPSGNLDSENAQNLHQLFLDLRQEFGFTFIIVTHNKELAGKADRVLTMKDGLIV